MDFLKNMPYIAGLITAIGAGGILFRHLQRAYSVSTFEKMFMSQEQKNWNTFLNYLGLYLLIVAIIFWMISTEYVIPPLPLIVRVIGEIMVVVWLLTWLMVICHAIYFKIVGYSKPRKTWFKRYIWLLSVYNLVGAVIFLAYFTDYSLQHWVSGDAKNVVKLGTITFLPIFLIRYGGYLFTKFNYVERRKKVFTLLIEEQELFVISSLDSKFLVLGNSHRENEATELYLYNKENKQLTSFKVVDEPRD